MKDMFNDNFLEELVTSSLSQIEELAKSNTIVGDPIVTTSGNTIIPISKVSLGYVVGGGQYDSNNKKLPYPSCGGSGGGVSINPIGFIIENDSEIKFVNIADKSTYQTVLNLVNTILSKFNNQNEGSDNEENL